MKNRISFCVNACKKSTFRFIGGLQNVLRFLRCNDILNTGMPKTKVRFKGQDLDMNSAFYSRAFTLNLSYRFGGYKKKNLKEVDTSRFGM